MQRNGLAILTDQPATNVYFIPQQPRANGNYNRSSRPTFGVQYPDGSVWWTTHSSSGNSNSRGAGANDAANQVLAISNLMTAQGVNDWAILGDFNRNLRTYTGGSPFGFAGGTPGNVTVVSTGLLTRPSSGRELDYMIASDQNAPNALQRRTVGMLSDHLAVEFAPRLSGAAVAGTIKSTAQPGLCLDLDAGTAPIGDNTRLKFLPCDQASATQLWSFNADGTITNNGLCLDTFLSAANEGGPVGLGTCDPAKGTQQWAGYANGQLYARFLPAGIPEGGRCLDTTAPTIGPPPPAGAGAGMSLRACSASPTQLFGLPGQGDSTVSGSGMIGSSGFSMSCLDHGQATLRIHACMKGDTDQQWQWGPDGALHESTTPPASPASSLTCLDNSGGNTDEGNPVIVYSCNNGSNQQWQARDDGSIYNPASDKCLTSDNTGALTITTCNNPPSPQQLWETTDDGRVRQQRAGLCLDHSTTGNGAPVQVLGCSTGDQDQVWSLPGDGTVRDNIPGRCLDNYNANDTIGNPIILWTCSGSSNQQWHLRDDGSLYNPATGKCAIADDGAAMATHLTLEPCTLINSGTTSDSDNTLTEGSTGPGCLSHPTSGLALVPCSPGDASQQWVAFPLFSIREGSPGSPGKCLDNSGGNTNDGNPVTTWTCNFNPNQWWQVRSDGSIYNSGSNKCLSNGPGLAIETCSAGDPQQKWDLTGATISQAYTPECLYQNQSTSDITNSVCTPGVAGQQFKLNGDGTLTTANGQCLDNYGGNTNDGNTVNAYTCNHSANQIWEPLPNGDLYNPASGKCATLPSQGIGTHLMLLPCLAALHWSLNHDDL